MADVTVVAQSDGSYAVDIRHDARTTSLQVLVPPGLPDILGCGHVAVVELVRGSIAFLLEREAPGSILPRFSLEEISLYFPDYPTTMRRILGEAGEAGP